MKTGRKTRLVEASCRNNPGLCASGGMYCDQPNFLETTLHINPMAPMLELAELEKGKKLDLGEYGRLEFLGPISSKGGYHMKWLAPSKIDKVKDPIRRIIGTAQRLCHEEYVLVPIRHSFQPGRLDPNLLKVHVES
jgi:hypothetical protein